MTLTITRIGETVRCKAPTCHAVVCTMIDGELRVRVKSQSVVIREAKSVSVCCENGHMNDFAVVDASTSRT